MKQLQHRLEAFCLRAFYAVLGILPLDVTSAVGGALGRLIGPRLGAHRTALKNLAMAFPEKTDAERRAIARGMWDNLGRVAAEFAHLPGKKLVARRKIIDGHNLPQRGQQALFFSGHLGNWETLPAILLEQLGSSIVIYRHANNPYVDQLISSLRSHHSTGMLAKGPKGAFKLARALKNKDSICMLVDQKMNDGIAVPLFGRDAMTAPAIAQLALRYHLPIIPTHTIRTGGAHFKAIIYPAMTMPHTGDFEADTRAIMTEINRMLEGWIRAYPEQWFWVHKRWPNA